MLNNVIKDKSALAQLFINFFLITIGILFLLNIDKKCVVIIDMAIDPKHFVNDTTYNIYPYKNDKLIDCSSDIQFFNNFSAYQIGQNSNFSINENEINKLKNVANKFHGYHVHQLLLNESKQWNIIHIGLTPFIKEKLLSVTTYINSDINFEMKRVRKILSTYQPTLVLVAASDTFEENYSDLIAQGVDSETAKNNARLIINNWKNEWEKTVAASPKSLFITSVGNGGIDGVGDNIGPNRDNGPYPANLNLDNVLKVASLNEEGCLSKFSNFPADIATLGENIAADIPCEGKKHLALNGTSQAAALTTKFLMKKINQKESLSSILKNLKKNECTKNQIRFGIID